MRLGLVGRKGSGKTSVANMLVDAGWAKLAFADPIKDIALDMLHTFAQFSGMHPATLERLPRNRTELEHHKEAFRPLLQFIGYDLPQQYLSTPNIWIDKLAERVERYPAGVSLVVDDVRFQHEVDTLRTLDFYVVRLHRPSLANNDGHASEAICDNLVVDDDVLNDTTLDKLFGNITRLLENHSHDSR